MTRLALILLLAAAAPTAAQALEQGRNGDQTATEHRPPPGMCRIWINGVPAERQPAPTDCATAMRRRPSNARVIFGDEVRGARATRPAVPQLTEPQASQQPNEPKTNDPRPNDTRPNDPRPNEPRPVDPNAGEPHPAQPRVQQPPPRPPVRMPPRPVAKPHKPGGPPMSRIRIH